MSEKDFMTITNADIYKKIEDSLKVQSQILDHAKYTNGKVAEAIKEIESIKKKSIGVWMSNNPVKLILIIVGLLSFMTQDSLASITSIVKTLI